MAGFGQNFLGTGNAFQGLSNFAFNHPFLATLGASATGHPGLALGVLGLSDVRNQTLPIQGIALDAQAEIGQQLGDVASTVGGSADFLPNLVENGQTILAGGQQGPTIDLTGAFDVGQKTLDFVRGGDYAQNPQVEAAYDEGFQNIQAMLERANTAAAGIDTDLSDVLAGRLAGIGQISGGRETQALNSLASQAASLGGLENFRRASSSLGFQEGRQRALEASQAVAQTRQEELTAQSKVADILSAANLSAGQLGTALTSNLATGRENQFQTELGAVRAAELDPLSRLSTLLPAAYQRAGFELNVGDTLAQIAQAYGMTTAQLLNVAPVFNTIEALGGIGQGVAGF